MNSSIGHTVWKVYRRGLSSQALSNKHASLTWRAPQSDEVSVSAGCAAVFCTLNLMLACGCWMKHWLLVWTGASSSVHLLVTIKGRVLGFTVCVCFHKIQKQMLLHNGWSWCRFTCTRTSWTTKTWINGFLSIGSKAASGLKKNSTFRWKHGKWLWNLFISCVFEYSSCYSTCGTACVFNDMHLCVL